MFPNKHNEPFDNYSLWAISTTKISNIRSTESANTEVSNSDNGLIVYTAVNLLNSFRYTTLNFLVSRTH